MPYAITGYFLKSGNVLLVRRKVFVPPPSVTVRALTFCAHSSHFGTHNGYPLRYELPRSSSLAREDKISNHKKRTQPQQSCDCVFFEIRQRVILPGAMCQVLSPRTSLTSVFGMGTGGTSSPLSPEWLRLLDLKGTDFLRIA